PDKFVLIGDIVEEKISETRSKVIEGTVLEVSEYVSPGGTDSAAQILILCIYPTKALPGDQLSKKIN
ncbi:MAG: hypothetical protein V2I97_09165, partial [Desulfococcaceae bacterium]|nr:hypothetical protein [Desulfococcaceae bacterium]